MVHPCTHWLYWQKDHRLRGHLTELLAKSLMLVTALVTHLGYDRASEIVKRAHQNGQSLRLAVIESGHVTAGQFDLWARSQDMLAPHSG